MVEEGRGFSWCWVVEEVRAKDDNITGELMIRKILNFCCLFCTSVDSVQRGGQVRLTAFGIY
jgi:hypothetical protein